ncbi:acetyl esterase [Salmonella enterica subsp. enterica serovar Heidelberg str. RI-11-013312]|nr:acetyl esterase [Salmonella enterica subsp. enterica serovar Heidelberg str. RI-11-013312]
MTTRTCAVPTPYGDVTTRLYSPQPTSQATLYYLHGGGFILGNLDTHDRIMRLLARYTGCTVIGIDYSLSPQARYPQAIEETVAVCSYFSQHADEYSLNVGKSVSPEIPQAPCWRLPARSGYVISTFAAVTLSRFCCGMGCMGCKIR